MGCSVEEFDSVFGDAFDVGWDKIDLYRVMRESVENFDLENLRYLNIGLRDIPVQVSVVCMQHQIPESL